MPKRQGTYEIREDDDGTLDELIVHRPEMVVLERMDTGAWQLRVFLEPAALGNPGEAVYVDLTSRKAIRPHVEINP